MSITASPKNHWKSVGRGLYRFQDSCAVWAYETSAGMLLVNAGTGAWMDALGELPSRPVALVLTHFFRDHSAGADLAAKAGVPVWAGIWEREQLADAPGHFQRRETWIIYDNAWDLFAPRDAVHVSRWLHDHEELTLGDATLRVIPTPGASLGAISILVSSPTTGRGVFCGEMIHSHGKIARIAPLQYNYNDLTGAPHLLYSIDQVRKVDPDWLAPSMGPGLIGEPGKPDAALRALEENLRFALESRGVGQRSAQAGTSDDLVAVTASVAQSRFAVSSNFFVRSTSGKVLAIDYGYRDGELGFGGGYSFPRNRRPLLHDLEAIRETWGASQISAVLVTHFHDDHVNGIPMLQRLHGTTCYASDAFAHILTDPESYAFPCTWPEPIRVDAVPIGESLEWEEYEFELHPVSGHTRFATLVSFVADGKRVVATGDQFFFQDGEHPGTGPSMHNHVYRNGAWLSSIRESVEIITRLRPQIVLPGHGPAYETTDEWFAWISRYADNYEELHRRLMPLGETDVHFEVDSRAAWIVPYRSHIPAPVGPNETTLDFTAHIRNPYPHAATLTVVPCVPASWRAESVLITLPARAEGEVVFTVNVVPGEHVRRCPLTIRLDGPDRTFGEVAEALVTVGGEMF